MCAPLAIAAASFVLTAGSQVAGHIAQNKASKANAEAARRAHREAVKDITTLQRQEKEAVAVSFFDLERQNSRVQAEQTVTAGEAGISGQSLAALEADINREASESKRRTQKNLDQKMEMLEREKVSGRSVMQQRIAAVPKANPFLTALNIGAAGASSFASIRATSTPGTPESGVTLPNVAPGA